MRFEMEVLVVDDASTDSTADLVASYSHVRYLRLPERRGVSQARNAGIAASTGRYIAFLDDDDLWLPNKLVLQVPALEAHPDAGMAYSQFIISSDGTQYVFPEPTAPSGSIFHHLLFINLCGIPAGPLLRREALDRVGVFNTTLPTSEDHDLWLRVAFQFPVLFVPGVVAVYRRSPTGHWSTALLNDSDAQARRLVLERALAKLPETEESESIKRQARATLELSVAEDLALLANAPSAWPYLRSALQMWPGIALRPETRPSVALIAGRYAAASPSPLAAAKQLWGEISGLLGESGTRERSRPRQMLAAIHWEAGIAQGKGIGCPANVGSAVQAVARSLWYSPFEPSRWAALLRFLFRSAAGRARSRLPHAREV